VYGPQGLPIKRVDLVGEAHGPVATPHVHDFDYNTNPSTGQVFPKKSTRVRSARPDELP
jgi:hypothetical protein